MLNFVKYDTFYKTYGENSIIIWNLFGYKVMGSENSFFVSEFFRVIVIEDDVMKKYEIKVLCRYDIELKQANHEYGIVNEMYKLLEK